MGLSIDYSRSLNARTLMQGAADSAALAALSKFEEAGSERIQIGKDAFQANIASNGAQISASPDVLLSETGATVTASIVVETVMLGLLNIQQMEVGVTAQAVYAPKIGPVCVLALDRSADQAIDIDGTATFAANDCVIHSNSRSDTALAAGGSTDAEADAFCAVGGHSGSGFTPEPEKNCSLVADPLADLEMPIASSCDYMSKSFNNGTHTASPGVYCNGLRFTAGAVVTLDPGIYVIKDGPLTLNANSTVVGNGVVFVFMGSNAYLDLKAQSNITVSAPVSGEYTGLAFVQDPLSSADETSSIEGGGNLQIDGAIYLPTQALKVGGEGEIGLLSDFMPIIAETVKFHGNAQVTVNIDGANDDEDDILTEVRTGTPRLIL